MKTKSSSNPSNLEIIRMMEDFERSKNVSVKEFCEMNDISVAIFRDWHYIYENHQNPKEKSGGFVSLEVESPKEQQAELSLLFAEVHGIRIYREVSPNYLKALLL